MIIVGGTYDERCFEPRWEEKFGSGLRGCRVIQALDPKCAINFFTFGDTATKKFLVQTENIFPSIKCNVTEIEKSISFYYDHPLITPRISPRLDTINREANKINVTGDNILYYGFIEGNAEVNGKNIVYDPQSPSNPRSFKSTGSKFSQLAIVVNYSEACRISMASDLHEIKKYFFEVENASVLVLKMGAKGAIVLEKNRDEEHLVPVYKTNSVWPIGSGDVFAAVFAYYWFHGHSAFSAAEKASISTAQYCSERAIDFANASNEGIVPLTIDQFPKGIIYLAGPFFTYTQRWLIDQIRNVLLSFRLNVFSPWHDIGHGIASEVVPKDLEGLEQSSLVFAVIDGLDSGTLFEVGYAVKKNIPIIAYVENESAESVKMLEGTGCLLEKDLTTAIYKAFWTLAEHG